MAISKGILKMSGAFGTASCYFLPGSDKMIVRAKGGPSARRMKVGAEFATVRKHQKEWKACVLFSQQLRNAFGDVYDLADYNVSPVWNGLGKNIVKTDTEHPVGERNLLVSKYKSELQGFNLNKNYKLSALLDLTPVLELNTETLYASATIPAFNSAQSILNVRKLPYFRIVLSFGMLSDIYYSPDDVASHYNAQNSYSGMSFSKSTEWLSTNDRYEERKIELQFPDRFLQKKVENDTYLLNMGIQFGNVAFGGTIEPVKYAGAGRCLLVK